MSLFSRKNHQAAQVDDPEVPHRSKYGIDDALQLMRTLPVDQHPDLVVLVVKNTLASMHVSLKDILRDAATKHDSSVKKIAELKTNIAQLEEQIQNRKQEVAAAETDLAELSNVMERLEAAANAQEPGTSAPTAPSRTPGAGPRLPPPPSRARPPSGAPPPDGDRKTMEVRDSAIELEPMQNKAIK